MPFNDLGLTALTQADGFTLWLYRTEDTGAAVSAAGYFDPAADRLASGDLVIAQAADQTAMVPIRPGAATGAALTLDTVGAALALRRSAAQAFRVTQAAAAGVRALQLAELPPALVTGETFQVQATVTGAIAAVTFSLRTAAGALVPPAQTVPVVLGIAVAVFTAPAVGGGWRLRAEDADDPAVVALSPPVFVASLPRLLTEAGGLVLTEEGNALLL